MRDSSTLSEWRVEQAQPAFNPTLSYFSIVETQLWPDWKYFCYKLAEQPEFALLFSDTRFSHIDDGPVVIELTAQEALFAQCVNAIETSFCGCIVSCSTSIELGDITELLKSRLIAKTEQSEALIRFYDPRTLLPLLASQTEEERRDFWSPIEQVMWHSKQWLQADITSIPQGINDYHWLLSNSHLATMQTVLQNYLRSFPS
jgi:hypothetical protein